ncbi:YVTN repeat-like/Quinoprotein amine dehydrogenase protein [Dioscorea alata]|uniref:YVTN repeat-like/Quinoprotein amine dehydrogenase protein n=1 Tax=Dioscorea alata TaxID=55571 RepID=A0ACB7WS42_DIOAL|nr:YVTN repeat-like/Quinoprotein amine dehydrogenase protein [Dioscorea alata]
MASRLKDRGGGGGKIMAAKPQKPLALADGTPKEKSSTMRRTPISGKENQAGLRWSTSSLLRGKPLNSSSEMSKLVSVSRVERRSVSRPRGVDKDGSLAVVSRVSEDRKVVGVLGAPAGRSSGRVSDVSLGRSVRKDGNLGVVSKEFGKKDSAFDSNRKFRDVNPGKIGNKVVDPLAVLALKDSSKKSGFESTLKSSGRKSISGVRVLDHQRSEAPPLAAERTKGDRGGIITVCVSKDQATSKRIDRKASNDSKVLHSIPNPGAAMKDEEKDLKSESKEEESGGTVIRVMEKCEDVLRVDAQDKKQKCGMVTDGIKVFENLNEKKLNGEKAKGIQVFDKYPSKLHEKLALLEGKVQKIASEIKRTKEMLDLNKQDESKLILSDIQTKITGLEKAVGQVMDGATQGEASSTKLNLGDVLQIKHVVNVAESKHSSKGLNHEQLEARFFPHHKLLRTRTSLSSAGEEDGGANPISLSNSSLKTEGGSLSPIDENSIAKEFLASLNGDRQSDSSAVRELAMEKTDSSSVQQVSEKEETEESSTNELFEIGCKTSTGGWFVSEGEAVLLAHDDGSCSYYDIANCEEKSLYKPPVGVSNNLWGDCWLVRAPGADGCSGKYIIAASAGNTLDSGFCSWDFYTKRVQAFKTEDGSPDPVSISTSRVALAPVSNVSLQRRSTSCLTSSIEGRQWWYRPCGPLLLSTASRQNVVSAHDIRDGDLVMKWEVNSPVVGMEYTSPLQWRSRGKVIIAETEAISLWDVNSLNPQPLLSVPFAGKKVYALHVNNTDAELGGGVRQRVSSSEAEGHDGVFCNQESVNVFDFRLPSGIGLKISKYGGNGHSIFSRGDSIFVGSTEARLPVRSNLRSSLQQFSLRKGNLIATYALPESNSHYHHSSITQVWGNSNLAMGISGMGLFVFDTLQDESKQSTRIDHNNIVQAKETIGPDNLYRPTFDYSGSRALIISRDRPAMWKYLL